MRLKGQIWFFVLVGCALFWCGVVIGLMEMMR